MSRGQWLTVGEAAERLGVAASTIRRYISRGYLLVIYLPSGHRRIVESSLELCARRHEKRLVVR